MNIFEFMCEQNCSLVVVKSNYNAEQTANKLRSKGINPVSYCELNENDIEPEEVEYTFN